MRKLSDKNIIVVDDSVIDAMRVLKLSMILGVKPDHIDNPLEAEARIAEAQPDLVIMDVEMPGIDGYEAARRLKANPKTKHIPIAIVTSNSSGFEEVFSEMVGAVFYVPKPVTKPALYALYVDAGLIKNGEETA